MLRNSKYIFNLVFAVALAIFFQTLETKAVWGDYDSSFGFGGVAVDLVTGYVPTDVAIQPDGKILVTGYRNTVSGNKNFFLRRYLSNGELDTSFGNNGAAIVSGSSIQNTDYRGLKIVVQANGKIAVAGRANDNYAVWQITSSGRSDKNFGQDGLQILTQYSTSYRDAEIHIQSGKLLLAFPKISINGEPVVLIRLDSNGAIDQTFGISGESLTGFQTDGMYSFGAVVESDGKITIGGKTKGNSYSKGLERKLANGSPDTTFMPTSSYNLGGSLLPGLVKSANSKYVMTMILLSGNQSSSLVIDKYSSNGVFEYSQMLYNGIQNQGCPDVFTNQADGKVLIEFYGKIFRLNAELDSNTMETNSCSNLDGHYRRAAIQADDKMVSVGVYNNNLILARTTPN